VAGEGDHLIAVEIRHAEEDDVVVGRIVDRDVAFHHARAERLDDVARVVREDPITRSLGR